MSSGENKEELMKFIFDAWKKADPQLLKGVEVFLPHEEKCHRFVQLGGHGEIMCTEIEELHCDHEEADTRMISLARHASQSYSSVIIKSPDTDVFVIALNACLGINANMLFETGTGNGRRIISLSKIRHCHGDQWCSSIIGFHAFTGTYFTRNKDFIHLFLILLKLCFTCFKNLLLHFIIFCVYPICFDQL